MKLLTAAAIKYQNICRNCKLSFKSYGWMHLYCKDCKENLQRQLICRTYANKYKAYRFTIPENGYGHSGIYKDIFCESTLQLAVLIWALEEKLPIKRNSTIIYYDFKEKQHRYCPDFEIEGNLYEIKEKTTQREIVKQESAKIKKENIIFIDAMSCEYYVRYVYSIYGLDPKISYTNFYSGQHQDSIKTNTKPKVFTLTDILQEACLTTQKEMLLNHAHQFRDKEIMYRFIKREAKQPHSSPEFIKQLEQAYSILYSK